MSARLAPAVLVAAVLAGLGIAGCGGQKDTTSSSSASRTVTSTRVQVIRDITRRGGFDPTAIYRRDARGVVTVISVFSGGGPGILPGGGQEGLGSGFVISGNGEIATNAHVVSFPSGSRLRQAGQVFVRFRDGNQVEAKIVGIDPFSDVALLRVDPSGLTLRPLALGSSSRLIVGSPIAAIGSPFNEPQSLSVGVISATGRTIDSLTNFQIGNAIQTDAAINHGNSGGPMVGRDGRVLGINSQIRSTGGGGEGVGFAVPVNTVRRSLNQLRVRGRVSYGYLGITTALVYPQLAEHVGLPSRRGALVQSVARRGPAGKAGIRGGNKTIHFQGQDFRVGGDLIVAVNGRSIRQDSDISNAIEDLRPGQRVSITLYHKGRRKTGRVKLGERPLRPARQ